MTTLIAFQPQNGASPPFQSAVMLDGATYVLSCSWNILGRWYFSIADQSSNVIYYGALVGSDDDYDTYLAPGIFQSSTILYRTSTGNFEIEP